MQNFHGREFKAEQTFNFFFISHLHEIKTLKFAK